MSNGSRGAGLSGNRLKRIAQLAGRSGGAAPAQPEIRRADLSGSAPLSFGQERLWFLDQLAPGNPFYTDCEAVRLLGEVDADCLAQAFADVLERHDVLRSRVVEVEGEPRQTVLSDPRQSLAMVSLEQVPEMERTLEVQKRARAETRRAFDLANDPLLRASLLRFSPREHALLMAVHHIVFDGWSLGVFIRDMMAFYRGRLTRTPPDLPKLRVRYSDFAAWQRTRIEGAAAQEHLAYWRQKLSGSTPTLLRSTRERPEIQRFRGRDKRFSIPGDLCDAIGALAKREKTSRFVVLLSAYKALIRDLSGSEDVVVGTPISNRTHTDTEGLIGFFINTLVLRTDLSGNPTFRQTVSRVSNTVVEGSEHQDLPFEKVVAGLGPQRTLGSNPLFQLWFTLLEKPFAKLETDDLEVEVMELGTTTSRLDLALIVSAANGLRAQLEYDVDLFGDSEIDLFQKAYLSLLQGAVEEPDATLDDLAKRVKRDGHQPLQRRQRGRARLQRASRSRS